MSPPRQDNAFHVVGALAFIDVSTKKHPLAQAIIDIGDLPIALDGGGRWRAFTADGRNVYVIRSLCANGNESSIRLHRHLLGFGPGHSPVVDHRDRDGLNNQRQNLRVTGHKGNRANGRKSKPHKRFKGVFLRKESGKYRAAIGINGNVLWLGSFDQEIDAARAYDAAARRLFGEFALLNFPMENDR